MAVGGSRNYRRFLVDSCEVQVRAGLLGRDRAFYPVINLGLGGIQFISFRSLKLGQRVQMSVKVGEQLDVFKAQAEIRWLEVIPGERAYRMGASFVKLETEDVQSLQRLEREFWPRQQQLQELGIKRLRLPPGVAQKLSIMVQQAGSGRRFDSPAVVLMRADGMNATLGHMGNLTRDQAGFGQWVDTKRGLIFKDPEASYGDRRLQVPSGAASDAEALGPPSAFVDEDTVDAGQVEAEEDKTDTDILSPTTEVALSALRPEPGSPDAEAAGEAPSEVSIERAGEAEPALEPDEAVEVAPEPVRHQIPLFVLGGGHTMAVDESGRPVEPRATTLSIPGLGPGTFACRLADGSMTSNRDRRYKLGDIIVFSMEREAADGSFALVATKESVRFRQVFYGPEGTVMLRALNPNAPVTWVHSDEVVAVWPSVAHVQLT